MSFNAKDMTQGGQIASMRIRMFSQIANIMLYPGFRNPELLSARHGRGR
ncbi:traD domain protein [Escherichia coli 1-182-04_S1_C3]|nr:traD domain protein [Escherichia coli 1-182-04_S1_C3]